MLIATVSTQRSGTKLLGNCFQAGTAVTPFGEVFNPDVPHIASFHDFLRNHNSEFAALGNDEILDRYFEGFRTIRGVFQIDVMFNQLEIAVATWNPHPYFGLYGYLRKSNAFVIDLRRSLLDSFVSMVHLSSFGGAAHEYQPSIEYNRHEESVELDENAFREYSASIAWHRRTLEQALSNYSSYYRLNYEELAQFEEIPHGLREKICAAANGYGIDLVPEQIQLHRPGIYRAPKPYNEIYSNYMDLKMRYDHD